MGPRGLWALGGIVVCWTVLTLAALESEAAARVIAVGVVTLAALALVAGVVAVSKGKRLFRRATRVRRNAPPTPPITPH